MTTLRIDGVAKEGDGVGRDADGRVTFVRGALPGETVEVEVHTEKKSFARASLRRVDQPHPRRITPACPAVDAGCGGCDFQHADVALQQELELRIVSDAFERIGRLDGPEPRWGGGIEPWGYRTTARCLVTDGRAGFRRHHSHDPVPADDCRTVHPAVADIIRSGRFHGVDEVVIRASVATGERVVLHRSGANGADRVRCAVPADVRVIDVGAGHDDGVAAMHERIAGRDWQVSPRSFLQASPAGADLLVETIVDQLVPRLAHAATLVDLYAGIGVIGGSIPGLHTLVAVESNPSAVTDAEVNLDGVAPRVSVVPGRVEHWEPTPADAVVADPSRVGLGERGVASVLGTGAATVVLVSCDAAAGARDVRALVDGGLSVADVVVLDLFPQTAQVEIVTTLVRR